MNISFDAKRAFHNARGLGNYSRDTIRLLTTYFPDNNYFLFNPTNKNNISFPLSENAREVLPESCWGKAFPSAWRTKGICKQIKLVKTDIFHGLSQELPWGIDKTGVQSIVTFHDAIFMRYPELYPASYRTVFIKKNKYACKVANRIIAISEQTKQDFLHYFDADERKIDVVYQGCNNAFRKPITIEQKERISLKYKLPNQYILNIGAIEKRKNAALIVEALYRNKIDIPLVIVGKPTEYKDEIVSLAHKYKLSDNLHFIHNAENEDLPAIYSLSSLFIFPSIFEGFGIPVLEALCTGTPVITSTGTCFEEVGGEFTSYINPTDADELGDSIQRILTDDAYRNKIIQEGIIFSEKFSDQNIARNLINVYKNEHRKN